MRLITVTMVVAAGVVMAWRPADPATIAPSDPGYEDGLGRRVSSVLASRNWTVPGGTLGAECSDAYSDLDQGKYAWPALLTLMHNATPAERAEIVKRNSTYGALGANNWLTNSSKCGTMFKPFNAEGLVKFLGLYRELITDEQAKALTSMQIQTGRNMLARPTGTVDPIYSYGEFDSENYLHMSRLSGLVAERVIPVPSGPYYRSYFQTFLSNAVRAWTRRGRLEWESQNYAGFNIQPAMLVFDHADNATQLAQARALIDWVLASEAIKTVDGFMIGPDARAKDVCVVPFAGSAWFYVWLLLAFDGAEGRGPSFGDAGAVAHADLTFLGQFPTSAYRPPQALVNIAQRRFEGAVLMHNAKPFYRLDAGNYADWAGQTPDSRRFEFETLWLHPSYTLGSLAAGRPNGACILPAAGLYSNGSLTFSEQSVWRLGVPATRARPTGALQVFGNAGLSAQGLRQVELRAEDGQEWRFPPTPAPLADLPFPFGTPAGRSAFEQIGQRRGAMLRVFAGADTAWVGLPGADSHDVRIDLHPWARNTTQAAFADLSGVDGQGPSVYVAILPLNAGPTAAIANFSDRKASAQTVAWSLDASGVGALALQVGTPLEFPGGYSDFVRAVLTNASLSLESAVRAWEPGAAKAADVPQMAEDNAEADSWASTKEQEAEHATSDGEEQDSVTLAGNGEREPTQNQDQPGPLSTGGGTVAFQPAGGGSLVVQHTGLGSYTLIDGTRCTPAGLYPRVTVDNTKLDYATWDVWRVVEGEPILTQKWGEGVLTATAGGAGVRITAQDNGRVDYELE